MEQLTNGETPTPIQIHEEISALHEDFYAIVPDYERTIWSPQEAIKLKTGGCMAELLYVAGSLLHDHIVDENDLSLRFRSEHGQKNVGDVMGRKKAHFGHVVLMLNIAGEQYECDFRANRADEKPQFQHITKDDGVYESSNVEFFTLEKGIYEYAHRAGVHDENIPTVSELVSLHGPESSTFDADQVQFDEDF